MPICPHIVQVFNTPPCQSPSEPARKKSGSLFSDEAKVRLNYSVFNASVQLFGLVADSERRHTMLLMVRRSPKTMTITLLERLGRWACVVVYICKQSFCPLFAFTQNKQIGPAHIQLLMDLNCKVHKFDRNLQKLQSTIEQMKKPERAGKLKSDPQRAFTFHPHMFTPKM